MNEQPLKNLDLYTRHERPVAKLKRCLKSLWVHPEDGNCTDCMGSGILSGDILCSCVRTGYNIPFPTCKERLLRLLSDPRFLERSPIITTVLLESANVMQLWRMYTEHSSLGQNGWSWLSVNVALWLWVNFYRAKSIPVAVRMTLVGILINTLVVLTVSYYQHDAVTGLLGLVSLLTSLYTLLRYYRLKTLQVNLV